MLPKQTQKRGWEAIEINLQKGVDKKQVDEVRKRVERIKNGERDLYF